MTLIGKTSHAMFFNGVSDSVVIPQAAFSQTGTDTVTGRSYDVSTGNSREQSEHTKMGKVTQSFTIEAWVIPDCGGIIAIKDGLFELRIGEVGTPGPAQFTVHIFDETVGQQSITLSTASPYIPTTGGTASTHTGWDGIVYPTHPSATLHGSHNRFNSSNDESALNRHVRDLIHIAGIYTGQQIKLYVNGDLVASEKLDKKTQLAKSGEDLYIGGRGGEFRGTIEGVHWRRGYNESGMRPGPLLSSADTIGLWRFEEPIDVPQLEMHLVMPGPIGPAPVGSILTVSNADGKALLEYITGSVPTSTTTLDLTTSSTYSNGNYLIDNVAPIPHTPINLLINPTGVDEKTGIAYQTSPPERVRVKSIIWNADGTTNSDIVVYSIHLDFSDPSGLRGLLHDHLPYDAPNQKAKGSTIVVINSDLLVDSGTGKPLRTPGMGTQVVDRTGQMIIDESNNANHGFIFNRQIATDTTNNPYAFNWSITELQDGFQAGHTGRHLFSHVAGHPYLRSFPPSLEERVERHIDGTTDSFSAYFDGQSMGLRDQLPIGTIVDVHRQSYVGPSLSAESSSTVVQAVENGMVGVSSTQRGIIALGGAGFNPTPFLLKGYASLDEESTNDTYEMHMSPEDTSRIAILEVSGLTAHNMAPYVEIHYNAIDLKGTTIQYAATGTSAGATHATVITLAAGGTKAFGPDISTFDAYYLICDGVRGKSTTGTNVTVAHGANTLTSGAALDAGFQAKLGVGAIVYREMTGPALCVSKTVPDAATIITGTTQVADLIHTAIASGATLHAPGGIIRIDDAELGTGSVALQPHRLVGDNTGGTAYELELNNSLLPSNHVPQNSDDAPQSPPLGVEASHVFDTSHPSIYHKMVIRPSTTGTSGVASEKSADAPIATAPSNYLLMPVKEATSNADGIFDTPSTTQRSNIFEMFDVIDNWQSGKTHCIVVQPSDRQRTMQLSKFVGKDSRPNDPNFISIEFLQTRGRIQEFKDIRSGKGRSLMLKGIGLMQDIRGAQSTLIGDGSPNSHPIKEIIPGGPVVSVSLGGPGQGAIDTKPTYDTSPMARVGWNTRHACAARIATINMTSSPPIITLKPLNNQSSNLASWGHICFPPSSGSAGTPNARIYLPSGASAAYYDISSSNMQFNAADSALAGWYVNGNGALESTFTGWLASNGVVVGTAVYVDPYIGDDTVCDDGTTAQDRMFQKLNSVQHDYQLGTQYASTRALTEIPLFPNQFFEDQDASIFPGPDNSMKLALDATMTAHTFAPNPVGRRLCGHAPANDPAVVGPYHYKWATETHRQGTVIVVPPHYHNGYLRQLAYHADGIGGGINYSGFWLLEVENPEVFPDAKGIWGTVRRRGGGTCGMRRVVLDDGEWCLYAGKTGNHLVIPLNEFGRDTVCSKDFFNSARVGVSIRPGGTQPFSPDIPVLSDGVGYSDATGQEFRSINYHDMANVQTQGGNIDYGLKQYVSAVEFKAGPTENPHLDKIESGTWQGVVQFAFLNSVAQTIITIDNEDSFPRIGAMMRHGLISDLDFIAVNQRNNLELSLSYMSATPLRLYCRLTSSYAAASVGASANINPGDTLVLKELRCNDLTKAPRVFPDAILNRKWLMPYAQGGLREGDTVWMNMHYTNPHAIDGMFCKSRGTLNDWQVHHMFNGGKNNFEVRSRNSIPMENFLIGNNCRETAENFAQHVNMTIRHNTIQVGDTNASATKRIVAFVDPYLSTADHARVLLYDVQHDREFIAFHDIHMQVQSSPDAIQIDNLDTANGFSSQRLDKTSLFIKTGLTDTTYNGSPKIRGDVGGGGTAIGKSTFIEGAYSHPDGTVLNVDRNDHDDVNSNALGRWALASRLNRNYQETSTPGDCGLNATMSTEEGVCCGDEASLRFIQDIDAPTTKGICTGVMGGGNTTITFNSLSEIEAFGKDGEVFDAHWLVAIHEGTTHNYRPSTLAVPRNVTIDYATKTLTFNLAPTSGLFIALIAADVVIHRQRAEELTSIALAALATGGHTSTLVDWATRFAGHTMDTPNGTRAIPAFLCLKGIRTTAHTPTGTTLSDQSSLPHWTQLEFTRRLSIDFGEVGIKEGITSIEAAAHEIVRLINQAGAPKGRSNLRRPVDQYPGSIDSDDASFAHVNADYAVTGSTHDPAPFWDNDASFASYDRGSHMGYLRAHVGRVVEDINGNEGYSIVIHSTIPGATGRNFCVWLDNSKGQTLYQPQFLVGHGGRFRRFYCQPDEVWGESMHPAPMPINKHGRPFAPITTLHELTPSSTASSDVLRLNASFPPSAFKTASGEDPAYAMAASGGGLSSNTVNTQSTTPNEQSVIQGLRVGTQAHAQINFGGMVATGIPGWSPDLGDWGFGDGTNTRSHSIFTSKSAITDYTGHVPAADRLDVGSGEVYAVEFQDHLNRNHRIRILNKQYGKAFSNENTIVPSTLDNEVVIWIDDRDTGQGGFTLGRHMKGAGDVGGRIRTGKEWVNVAGADAALDTTAVLGTITENNYCGNRWNPVHTYEGAFAVTAIKPTGTTLTLQSGVGTAGAFGREHAGIWHDLPSEGDALGFLGFPQTNGMIQMSIPDPSNQHLMKNTGYYVFYTHRTTASSSGPHVFYGCSGLDQITWTGFGGVVGPDEYGERLAPICISARPNWTTLITDELIAASVEFALTMDDPNNESEDSTSFDCRDMYAADGRTFGEWGISETAIRVQSFSKENNIIPPSKLFEVSRQPDWGIVYANAHDSQVKSTHSSTDWANPLGMSWTAAQTFGASNTTIDSGMIFPCGYIPRTVLHINTRYRGTNANTATPRIVNSRNNPIDMTEWEQNLRGERYRFWPGDHILPRIENADVFCDEIHDGNPASSECPWYIRAGKWPIGEARLHGVHQLFHFGPIGRVKCENVGSINNLPPAALRPFQDAGGNQAEDASYVQQHTVWVDDEDYAMVEPMAYDVADTNIVPASVVAAATTLGEPYNVVQHHHAFSRLAGGSLDVTPGGTATTLTESDNFDAKCDAAQATYGIYLQKYPDRPVFDGVRTTGSHAQANPITYFRGASDSVDHSVPLYFGGGFSGAVLDINDGTENDYTDFYTHPYSAGPTGCAGIQQANEIMGSHCILDTTALMAMFPGTGYLDQHKGSAVSPFHNQDLQLSPDMAQGASNVPNSTGPANVDADPSTAGYEQPGAGGNKTVIQTQPTPIVIRFAHPFSRYEDVQDAAAKTETTYLIFGPGQSIPTFMQSNYAGSPSTATIREPSVAISVGCLQSDKLFSPRAGAPGIVPTYPYAPMAGNTLAFYGTPSYAYLPNEVSFGNNITWSTPSKTTQVHGWAAPNTGWLPPTTEYQATNVAHWQGIDNWEPAQGDPNDTNYNQENYYGKYLSDHFKRHDLAEKLGNAPSTNIWSYGSTGYAQPFSPIPQSGVINTLQHSAVPGVIPPPLGPTEDAKATADLGLYTAPSAKDLAWHMDGGHPPGGNFLDDRVVRNPTNFGVYCFPYTSGVEATGAIPGAFRLGDNASMYRVAGVMLKQLFNDWAYTQDNYTSGAEGSADRDVVVIDASRVQNAEELATVISCAINEWPGTGALKALGGTFLPSFQHAHKQDRYSWVELPLNRTVGAGAFNARPDHLTFCINGAAASGSGDHFGGETASAGGSTTIGIDGIPNYIPYELPISGIGRIFLDVGGQTSNYLGADQTIDTSLAAADRGLYFYYKGISNSDDVDYGGSGATPTGANRSFYLATNYRSGLRAIEDPTRDATYRDTDTSGVVLNSYPGMKYMECAVMAATPPAVGVYPAIYAWTKTGNHRWSNGGLNTALTVNSTISRATALNLDAVSKTQWHGLACTHVHFNGLHDAVDRTRPIGAVGWNGNQYSMLNSIGTYEKSLAAWAIPRGLGGWHSFLGFNPYGNTMACHYSNFIGQYQPQFEERDIPTDASTDFTYSNGWSTTYNKPKGTHERHYVVITHESELPLIARADRLGIHGTGDRLSGIWTAANVLDNGPPAQATASFMTASDSITAAATTAWSTDIHSPSRYTAPATGGPYIEALVPSTMANPTTDNTKRTNKLWGSVVNDTADLIMADACAAPTGDLFTSTDWLGVANTLYQDTNGLSGTRKAGLPALFGQDGAPHRTWHNPVDNDGLVPGLNFTVEHAVWKRMDGGNLSLPSPNARGLGAVPWTWRKSGGNYYKTGETTYGNCRFSFETTNSAMLPVIQSQELGHPSLAEQYPHEIGDVLMIPNEEIQFESIIVIDDTGQEHTIEGGSPFGTIIRDFKTVANRTDEGMSPSLSGSGIYPNMEIQLPDPDTIPGNIIVRSGFDRIQSYQHETVGTGGLQHPSQPVSLVSKSFNDGPPVATWPTWENNEWETISNTPNTNLRTNADIGDSDSFPDSSLNTWNKATDDAPISTSYEPHDRALYFHITQHAISYSQREPVAAIDHIVRTPLGGGASNIVVRDNITVNQTTFTGTDLIYGGTVHYHATYKGAVFGDPREQLKDGSSRWYVVGVNSAGKRAIASYTGLNTGATKFTGVVFGPGWDSTFNGADIYPSFYTPAGTARLFAARRLRDHAEVSGNSPDMPRIDWYKLNSGGSTNPYDLVVAPKLTPMPIPRMGHNYITPTMAVMPGHLAHPVYQNLYGDYQACAGSRQSLELDSASVDSVPVMDPNIWFSNLTANYPPSDIHGGAFTLMSETKIRFDGYGVLASNGVAGEANRKGGHVLFLESNGYYTQTSHFPDPLEVGAYQIVIQPNVFSQQITGFHQNTPFADTTSPRNAADGAYESDVEQNLTGQQVATVVSVFHDWANYGATGLVLADALSADVRGCEVYLNEIMLDIDPAPGQQFTSLPPLASFNSLGVNESTSPAFSRRSLPYHPTMFKTATPGYTLTIPWWAIGVSSGNYSGLTLIGVDDYYLFCRSTYGAISAQITLAGYPSHFFEPYTRELQSINPKCTVLGVSAGAPGTLTVDDNLFFPLNGTIYNRVLVAVDSKGNEHRATYTTRGTSGDATVDTVIFNGVTPLDGAGAGSVFWLVLTAGNANYSNGVVRLEGPHRNYQPGENLTDSRTSPLTRILPQVLSGSRDTNNLYLADAYLCMWHHNLGRPFTAFSEGRATAGSPAHQKPYNIMPESFEMVHYHEFTYAVSTGPFALGMKWMTQTSTTNAAVDPDSASPTPTVAMPSGDEFFFGGFWPGGSRYGGSASRLDMWGDVERGWNVAANPFDGSCVAYTAQYNAGPALDAMEIRTDQTVTSTWTNFPTTPHNGVPWTRNYCFGYRFSVRQPYNRPRWAIAIKSVSDAAASYTSHGHYAYYNGPMVQAESGTWTSRASTPAHDATTLANGAYVGMLERQTNASNLLGFDLPGWQVRYSDGRRMTRPFGCPVRTLRNHALSRRQFPGDHVGKAIEDLVKANMYYVVDWWGNTTGEDVRRFPVRGFGLRPAFDPEAWRWNASVAAKPVSLFHHNPGALTVPSTQEGNRNETNNTSYNIVSGTYTTLADFFDPLDSIRVGDRGDGRGVRCPIFFNEYVAQSVDTIINPIGMMLSYHTAEPPFTLGLLRPRNDTIQDFESPRGISSRLSISDDDGLMKKEGMPGRNLELSSGVFGMEGLSFQEPISRLSPRIGLDTLTVGEVADADPRDYIIQATQAISLHTDREVGQRYIFEGSYKHTMFPFMSGASDSGSETSLALGHLDFTKTASMTWADPPSILKFNNAHGVSPLGGNYIMEVSSYVEPFDDTGWGIDTANAAYVLATFGPTSNPYQSNTAAGLLDPMRRRTNAIDKSVRFLVRPYRALDYRHVALFRPIREPPAGPQASSTKPFFKHSAGSRYGLFNYEMSNARASTSGRFVLTSNPSPTTPPYVASYIPNQSNYSDNKSHGPKIPGVGMSTTYNFKDHVARLIISENTLQHYRSDAPRRQSQSDDDEESSSVVIRQNYETEPRYSQSLHPKGEDGTTDFNTSDHNDDTPDNYTHIRKVDY